MLYFTNGETSIWIIYFSLLWLSLAITNVNLRFPRVLMALAEGLSVLWSDPAGTPVYPQSLEAYVSNKI